MRNGLHGANIPRRKAKSLTSSPILYALLFFAVTDNRYLSYTAVLAGVYALRFLFAVCGYFIIFRSLKRYGKTEYPAVLIFQLIYFAVIVISGAVNGNLSLGILYSAFVWLGITNYIVVLAKKDLRLFKSFDLFFQLLILATLFLALFFPDAVTTYSYDGSRIIEGFFGGKNALPMYLLAGICLSLVVFEIEGKHRCWRTLFYPFICMFLLYFSGCGTGLVTAAVFLFLYYTGIFRLINAVNLSIAVVLVNISVVFLRVQERFLYSFIVYTLRRDITLTYRTDIWKIAVDFFYRGWFLGYGLGNSVIQEQLRLPIWFRDTINEAHNGFLDIALGLGIAGLIPLLTLIFIVVRKYDRAGGGVTRVLKLYFAGYLVIAVTENAFTLSRLTFWFMLFSGLALFTNSKYDTERKEKPAAFRLALKRRLGAKGGLG